MKSKIYVCMGLIMLSGMSFAATITDGTALKVKIKEPVSSNSAFAGQRIKAEIDADVLVNDVLVIKKGTSVKMEVADSQKSGRLGKGGSLGLHVISTKAIDGTEVPLAGSLGKGGSSNTGSTVALTVLFGGLGLLRKGQNASIPLNTVIDAFVDSDIKVDETKAID